jgi:6-phosphogluconolactonase
MRSHYIYPDLDTLAGAFVCEVHKFLEETNQEGREVHIALSGGSTPLSVFRQLVHTTSPEDWRLVHLYWGDERCVPPSSSESNYGNARRLFIDALKFPEDQVHPILGDEFPAMEARRYGELLLDRLPVQGGFPVFDWIWLGLGEDGHTASIFPNQLNLWNSEDICAVATHPESGQKRITLTGGVINAARRIAFLVSGKQKSAVINEIVMKEGSYLEYPAFYVRPDSGYLEWFLDMEATSWL